jgi:hypothetical protein
MSAPQSSLLTRVAVNSMDLALRFWPESSRRWGQALLAEMGEISEPSAVLNWAAGGILLFFRAVLAHLLEWLKLPAGATFSGESVGGGGNGPQFPKLSRLATALILLGTAVLFFLPMGREATGTVKASWRGFVASDSDRRSLEKIAARAEKEKDARGLAFVALSYPDADRAGQFADRAVTLDPSLVWIYASRYYDKQDWSKTAERLKRLENYDGENAFVHLVNAYAEAEPRIEAANSTRTKLLEETLTSDSEWTKEMDQAFRAPSYNNYSQHHEELAREGWKKNPILSPSLIISSMRAHWIPNFYELKTYANQRISQALRVGSAGKMEEAESMLDEIVRLGTRMSGAAGANLINPMEQMFGFGLTQHGLEGLQRLYDANGQENKAKGIEVQLRESKASAEVRTHSYVGWRVDIMSGFRPKAIAVQASAILSLILGVAVALSLLVLEAGAAIGGRRSGGWKWVLCRLADYGPVLLLLASVVFLWSFRPIAEIFEQYRAAEHVNFESMGLFWQLFVLGDTNPLLYFYETYHQWLVVMVVLGAIVVGIIVRAFWRRKRDAATTS